MSKSYRTTCPVCGGDNFVVTPSKGFSYCFNCTYHINENTAPIVKEMSAQVEDIRHLYTQAAIYYHTSLDKRAHIFLQQRGFTDNTIQDLQIGYCPPGISPLYKQNIAKEAGLTSFDNTAFLGDRITFPYFNEPGIVTDIRGRAIDTLAEPRYLSLLGGSYFRGAIYPYNYHLRYNAKQIIITDGEIKADISCQIGYATMALPGIGTWRDGFIENEDTEYILLYDNQRANYFHVQAAIVRTAKRFKSIKIATLPLLGKDKQDIDSFILNHGVPLFKTVIEAALPFQDWYVLQRF